jgi:hypothetical protein
VLWEGMIDENVRAPWEPWMIQADRLLEAPALINSPRRCRSDGVE